ncbi:phosphorylase [Bradyrhizobium sp. WD16]|uniref:phosphorylase n=1 Tax=Bradyrhizobium sp. WD16 TaxID=1521768 RepID=UPI0020A33318|nr:phosphorylase [Bradyrhizobium sp. WD16]UTD26415.1 phosphorylase [Bradyrhizobium sp. WD16]
MILGAGGDANSSTLPVLIVTGLRQEARIAAGPGMTVVCSSSSPRQLREMMTSFDPACVRGIVSFGVAGGLDPELRSGDVVVATEVVTHERRWQAVAAARDGMVSLSGSGRPRVIGGILAGSEDVVLGPAVKAELRARTGAAAVDMESHIAASYAEDNGLPFAAVRVISDPASRSLPALAMDALKPDGKVDIWKVMRGIAINPMAIPALVSAGRDFNRALRSLSGCRSLLLGSGSGGLVGANL